MTDLNHENIEFWMFQHHEGLLTKTQSQELLAFLKVNPVYQGDFEAWSMAKVIPDNGVMKGLEEAIREEHQKAIARASETQSFWAKHKLWITLLGSVSVVSLFYFVFKEPIDQTKDKVKAINTVIVSSPKSEEKLGVSSLDETSLEISRSTGKEEKTTEQKIEATESVEKSSSESRHETVEKQTETVATQEQINKREVISETVSMDTLVEKEIIDPDSLLSTEFTSEKDMEEQELNYSTSPDSEPNKKTIDTSEPTKKNTKKQSSKFKRSNRFEPDSDDF